MGKHCEVTESVVFSRSSSDVILGQRTGVFTQLVGRLTVVTSSVLKCTRRDSKQMGQCFLLTATVGAADLQGLCHDTNIVLLPVSPVIT